MSKPRPPSSESSKASLEIPLTSLTSLETLEQTRVGLLPSKGWQQRNIQFLNKILIPHLLAPRLPKKNPKFVTGIDPDQTLVTWLGHAGFLVQIGGFNVLVDPNWALWHGPVKRVVHPSLQIRDLPYIDCVLITHAHFDHLHLPTLRAVASGQPIIVPQGVGKVVDGCAFSKVIEMDYWQTVSVADLHITFVPTKHWGARFIHDTYRKFGAYLISSGQQTVFHCGDSSMFDGFQEIGKRAEIDIALMPIGAYVAPSGRAVHMNPEEAVEAFEMMNARHMVPMHYGTFPLGGEPLHEPEERIQAARISAGYEERIHVLHDGESLIYQPKLYPGAIRTS